MLIVKKSVFDPSWQYHTVIRCDEYVSVECSGLLGACIWSERILEKPLIRMSDGQLNEPHETHFGNWDMVWDCSHFVSEVDLLGCAVKTIYALRNHQFHSYQDLSTDFMWIGSVMRRSEGKNQFYWDVPCLKRLDEETFIVKKQCWYS